MKFERRNYGVCHRGPRDSLFLPSPSSSCSYLSLSLPRFQAQARREEERAGRCALCVALRVRVARAGPAERVGSRLADGDRLNARATLASATSHVLLTYSRSRSCRSSSTLAPSHFRLLRNRARNRARLPPPLLPPFLLPTPASFPSPHSCLRPVSFFNFLTCLEREREFREFWTNNFWLESLSYMGKILRKIRSCSGIRTRFAFVEIHSREKTTKIRVSWHVTRMDGYRSVRKTEKERKRRADGG